MPRQSEQTPPAAPHGTSYLISDPRITFEISGVEVESTGVFLKVLSTKVADPV